MLVIFLKKGTRARNRGGTRGVASGHNPRRGALDPHQGKRVKSMTNRYQMHISVNNLAPLPENVAPCRGNPSDTPGEKKGSTKQMEVTEK